MFCILAGVRIPLPLKQLAGQTAVYGLSTVLVRMLNYLLVPFHTRVFLEQADYGVVSAMYAYVTFLNVIFLFGLETAYFRFATHSDDPQKAFRTASGAHWMLTFFLGGLMILFAQPISALMGLPDHPEYVRWFALIIGLDTLVAIPFARLRLEGRPMHYFFVKLFNVLANVCMNVVFLWKPAASFWGFAAKHPNLFSWTGFEYDASIGPGYVFLANLVASGVTFLVFMPLFVRSRPRIDSKLLRQMLSYSWPLLIVGFAGMINETLDRILLLRILPGTEQFRLEQVGIYSAVYKLAIFMTLAVQAFRMGAEPFFFKQSKEGDARKTYAQVMDWFVAAGCAIFLLVSLFVNQFAVIIGPSYRQGLDIVPVLLLANLFLGIYYNLSVWYKLTDRTRYAMLMVGVGAVLTLGINLAFIPQYGFRASAWATLAAYAGMTLLSWFFMRRYYPVPYNTGRLLLMLGGSVAIVLLVGLL